MSISCTICQEYLVERPTGVDANEELIMCALTCGHMYHRFCVQQWFNNGTTRFGADKDSGECPLCKRVCSLRQSLRIYPTCDEDSAGVGQQKKTLDQLKSEIHQLSSSLEATLSELVDLKIKYDGESESHEMLKVQYAEALSKLETQTDEIKENRELSAALESSVATALDKSEKEKEEAVTLLTNFKDRYQKLLNNMETLWRNGKEDVLLLTDAVDFSQTETIGAAASIPGITQTEENETNADTLDGERDWLLSLVSSKSSSSDDSANFLFEDHIQP